MPALMTVAEVAADLGLSPSRVRELCHAGTIRAQRAGERLWLIAPVELTRYRRRMAAEKRTAGPRPKVLR